MAVVDIGEISNLRPPEKGLRAKLRAFFGRKPRVSYKGTGNTQAIDSLQSRFVKGPNPEAKVNLDEFKPSNKDAGKMISSKPDVSNQPPIDQDAEMENDAKFATILNQITQAVEEHESKEEKDEAA